MAKLRRRAYLSTSDECFSWLQTQYDTAEQQSVPVEMMLKGSDVPKYGMSCAFDPKFTEMASVMHMVSKRSAVVP
eukprot:CAMPEP_0117590980 /NCGR_PEP_ID=MMETSP0784-20121206/71274_1 /TAXON_ID=39447 /ORGANISM="" /LENGTH=74 /DNA_ID=CAMNT_0005392643 /DNA_START=364 /DNA_END=584 /DNA_ORIENTATION=-